MKPKPRVLFIKRGAAPPNFDPSLNRFHFLSSSLTGDLVQTTWPMLEEDIELAKSGMGDFEFHRLLLDRSRFPLNSAKNLFNLFRKSFQLFKKKEYDAIVTYGPYLNSVVAFFFSRFYKVPLIVEVPGHPVKGFIGRKEESFISTLRIKRSVARLLARFVCQNTDYVRTLYPDQLDCLEIDSKKVSIFHEFVPVTNLSKRKSDGKPEKDYILTMGMPWYIKGVDILIKAFLEIADEYPDLHLKVVGFEVSDREFFEKIAGDHPRIELCQPVLSKEAYKIISQAKVFALASRTESMGRVLLESMAFQVPIIASRVDGIPYYVEDGITGLLFEPGNVGELARCLRETLNNKKESDKRVEAASARLLASYNEAKYVEEFTKMVEELREKAIT